MPNGQLRITPTKFAAISAKSGGRCFYCGKIPDPSNGKKHRMTLDHVLPRCEGGRESAANLVLSCYRCNSFKSDRSLDEFRTFFGIFFAEIFGAKATEVPVEPLETPLLFRSLCYSLDDFLKPAIG